MRRSRTARPGAGGERRAAADSAAPVSRSRYIGGMRKAPSRSRPPRRRGPSRLAALGRGGRRLALLLLLGAALAYPGAFLADALLGAIFAAVP